MTKSALWAAYVAKNPTFAVPGCQVTMSSDGLKKLFDQTYDLAFAAGHARGTIDSVAKVSDDSFAKILDVVFNGRKA